MSTTDDTGWWDQATDAVVETYDAAVEVVEQTWDTAVEAVDAAYDWAVETASPVWEEAIAPAADPSDAADVSVLPWIAEYCFEAGGTTTYLNYEGGKVDIDTGWARDAIATGASSALAGLLTAALIEFASLEALVGAFLANAAAPVAAAWRGYEGFAVQQRISCQAVEVHEWYGRYRYNLLTGEILAVDFHGIGPTLTVPTIGWREERLTDAEGNVVYTPPPVKLSERVFIIPRGAAGFDFDSHQNMPEWTFGDDQIWETDL